MKHIISNFLGGLSESDRNEPENTFVIGREIDIHRDLGYLRPGDDLSMSVEGTIDIHSIKHILADPNTDNGYSLSSARRLHRMSCLGTLEFNDNLDAAGNPYHDLPAGSAGESLAYYPIGTTDYLFYFYNKTVGGECGRYNLETYNSQVFDDDWMSDVPAGKGALQKAPHPNLIWKSYLWIANGRYLARFDGQSGANGTLDLTKLTLGEGLEITSLFITKNYIGICATDNSSQDRPSRCEVFFWNGSSSKYIYSIPLNLSIITASKNHNGVIYLTGVGRDNTAEFGYLTDNGFEKITSIRHDIAGSVQKYNPPYCYGVDIFQNKLVMGMGGAGTIASKASIFSYGKTNNKSPMSLTLPWSASVGVSSRIGAIKTAGNNCIVVSYFDGTNFKIGRYNPLSSSGYSTTAQYKGNYFDTGQKIRINYVKFYFKPLVASDDITPSLELDYGTAFTLKDKNGRDDITYANDGAITSKRFDVNKDCHAFRPVIDWNVGGVAISKIVVDYNFISDL